MGQLKAGQDQLLHSLPALATPILRTLKGRTEMSEAREDRLVDGIIENYDAEHPEFPHRVRCCVTGRYVDKHLVTGAHILPVSAQVGSQLLSSSAVPSLLLSRARLLVAKATCGYGTHQSNTCLNNWCRFSCGSWVLPTSTRRAIRCSGADLWSGPGMISRSALMAISHCISWMMPCEKLPLQTTPRLKKPESECQPFCYLHGVSYL